MGLFGKIAAATGLPQPTEIRQLESLVPSEAEYCTLGVFSLAALASELNAMDDSLRGFRRNLSMSPPQDRDEGKPGILVITPGRLQVITLQGVMWECLLGEIREVDAHRFSGFVVTGTSSRLIVSNQMPVRLASGSHCRTAGRVTNRLFGWDDAFRAHGIPIRQ